MNHRYRGFLLPGLLALAGGVALMVDLPIGKPLSVWNSEKTAFDKTIHEYLGYFDIFEPFGHGLGVLLVLLALHQLDPGRRWAIPRIATCAFAAGGVADLVKMLIVRIRPKFFNFDDPALTTFGQWLPGISAGSGGQSFPSAHTATAMALAAALIWLYPNGRVLFSVLAVLVGCQRITSGAHFPSDVFFGAAVGCAVAQFWLNAGFVSCRFETWENRWRAAR
jgi:membrane-associated phospholipid phosphatase